MLSALELSLILLACSVFAVAGLRLLQLPALLAYLLVGVLLGLFLPQIDAKVASFEALAHFGVVFLMFSIGLEFNLAKLSSMRQFVFGLGASQVMITIVLGAGVMLLAPAAITTLFLTQQLDWRMALVLSGALAMSSTALVGKLLSERGELDSEHGRRVMGVLLFQDLAVIPLLVLLPAMAGQQQNWMLALGLALFKATCLLFILFRVGRGVLRKWFALVARRKSHELFTLNVLLVTLAMAWMTEQVGLSLELGAFVAGMLIAETEFRFQVEEDIKSFRDVLLGLFFISLGLRLNLHIVLASWWQVMLLAIIPMAGKFAIVLALARVQKASTTVSAKTALYLAQAGEFGFVILTQASGFNMLSQPLLQIVLAAMILSLVISPIVLANSDKLLLRWSGQEWMRRSMQLQSIASRSLARERHIIICGYGRSGQSIAHVLETEKIAFVALDLDPDRISAASRAGESVVYGDASRREALLAAGVHRASALVVSVSDTPLALKILALARELAPQLPVLVRTSDQSGIEILRAAGAAEVVPEVAEGSLVLASHALVFAGVPIAKMQQRVAAIRNDRYHLLHGFFHGADDHEDLIERADEHLLPVLILAGSAADGCSIEQLNLEKVKVAAVLRKGLRTPSPSIDTVLKAGDTLVISGPLIDLTTVQDRLTGASV
jgi:monovalent cation:H+ antiporter-2, CPA2 family